MIPFLVEFAEKPVDDEADAVKDDGTSPIEQRPEHFHTRCGHPRRRDD